MSVVADPQPNSLPPGSQSSSQRAVTVELTFVHWVPRDDPPTGVIVALTIAAAVAAVAFATRDVVWGAVALVGLVAASWSAVFPIHYTFTASGIERRFLRFTRRISWAAVARCESWPGGVRLFRTADARPLDALASVYIPFTDQRDAIFDQLKRRALRCQVPDSVPQ